MSRSIACELVTMKKLDHLLQKKVSKEELSEALPDVEAL